MSSRRSDSEAAFVCGGRSSGWDCCRLLSHPVQARRVLPDEQLRGEVEGVERTREGSQLRLVDLEAHHLAHAELHPVEAHGPVVFEVGQHEEEGQFGRELGAGSPDGSIVCFCAKRKSRPAALLFRAS